MFVFFEPIFPPIRVPSKTSLRFLHMILQPGKHVSQSRPLVQRRVRHLQSSCKGLLERLCNPWIIPVRAALYRDDMHDWEDLGVSVVFTFDLFEIREQTLDLAGFGVECGRLTSAENGIQFSVREHLREVLALLYCLDIDAWR